MKSSKSKTQLSSYLVTGVLILEFACLVVLVYWCRNKNHLVHRGNCIQVEIRAGNTGRFSFLSEEKEEELEILFINAKNKPDEKCDLPEIDFVINSRKSGNMVPKSLRIGSVTTYEDTGVNYIIYLLGANDDKAGFLVTRKSS